MTNSHTDSVATASTTPPLPKWFNDSDRERFASISGNSAANNTQIITDLTKEINDEFLSYLEAEGQMGGYLLVIKDRLESMGDHCSEFLSQCISSSDGRNVIQYAVSTQKIRLCKLLAEHGCNFYAHYENNPAYDAPIHSVVAEGCVAFLAEFVSTFNESEILKIPGEFSYLPLHVATLCERPELFNTLAQAGASACAVDADSTQPIHILAAKGDIENIETFVRAFSAHATMTAQSIHPILDARDGMLRTPLHIAASQGNCELCAFLINNGAHFTADELGRYPHHYAALNGHADTLELLLDNSEDLPVEYVYDLEYNSLLHCAASCEDEAASLQMCTNIIATYPGIQFYSNMQGYSPMHFAAFNEYQDLCLLLITSGIIVPIIEHQKTSILYTMTPGSVLYYLLLDNGANPELLACSDLPEEWLYLDEAQNKFRIFVPPLPKGMDNSKMAEKLDRSFAKLSCNNDEEYDDLYGMRSMSTVTIEEDPTPTHATIATMAEAALVMPHAPAAANIWSGGGVLVAPGAVASCDFVTVTAAEDQALDAEVIALLGSTVKAAAATE